MSHSQIRSQILILRHAWLNPWDEHITTGRINQVTYFYVPVCCAYECDHVGSKYTCDRGTSKNTEPSWIHRPNGTYPDRVMRISHRESTRNIHDTIVPSTGQMDFTHKCCYLVVKGTRDSQSHTPIYSKPHDDISHNSDYHNNRCPCIMVQTVRP